MSTDNDQRVIGFELESNLILNKELVSSCDNSAIIFFFTKKTISRILIQCSSCNILRSPSSSSSDTYIRNWPLLSFTLGTTAWLTWLIHPSELTSPGSSVTILSTGTNFLYSSPSYLMNAITIFCAFVHSYKLREMETIGSLS